MSRPTVTQIAETTIAYDRPALHVSPEWVKFRFDFFRRYTLQSLLNQSRKEFRIFILCGNRHRTLLESLPWPPSVTACFDDGREAYGEIDTDYLAISRIDSDDLFHRESLEEIRAGLIFGNGREVLAYKTRIVWDLLNGLILASHPRASSPFFTHIFPRKIYQDWPTFKEQHLRCHGSGGAGDLTARPLKDGRVCVVKHGHNISLIKRGQTWPVYKTRNDRQAAYATYRRQYPGLEIWDDRLDLVRILADFGIEEDAIP